MVVKGSAHLGGLRRSCRSLPAVAELAQPLTTIDRSLMSASGLMRLPRSIHFAIASSSLSLQGNGLLIDENSVSGITANCMGAERDTQAAVEMLVNRDSAPGQSVAPLDGLDLQ